MLSFMNWIREQTTCNGSGELLENPITRNGSISEKIIGFRDSADPTDLYDSLCVRKAEFPEISSLQQTRIEGFQSTAIQETRP